MCPRADRLGDGSRSRACLPIGRDLRGALGISRHRGCDPQNLPTKMRRVRRYVGRGTIVRSRRAGNPEEPGYPGEGTMPCGS